MCINIHKTSTLDRPGLGPGLCKGIRALEALLAECVDPACAQGNERYRFSGCTCTYMHVYIYVITSSL